MPFVYNVPFFSIFLAMAAGICLTLVKRGPAALRVTQGVIGVIFVLSGWLTAELLRSNSSFIYPMGHYPAPWGNELRAALLKRGWPQPFV